MSEVLIIVNAEVNETGKIIAASPATEKMVDVLEEAIATYSPKPVKTEIVAAATLWSNSHRYSTNDKQIICPLTIELPDFFEFPKGKIYSACRNIKNRRHWVEQHLGYKTSVGDSWLGDLWLPVVLTTKGPLYGEVIGEGVTPNSYEQPVDLPDSQRKSLYRLAYNLLESISASPAVYLLQFRIRDREIVFDRLWPFPAAPALASLRVQQPNLFTCHWFCLTDQPILDLTIIGAG